MRIHVLILSLLAGGCSSVPVERTPHASKSNHQPGLSGKATVDGLGLVAFPPGNWLLEFRGSDTNHAYSWGDYFVFRRTGQPPHRLTIFRIPPGNAAPALSMYLDTLWETMGDGVPVQQQWPKEDKVESGHPLRTDPPNLANANDIEFSFMSKMESGMSWLTHAHLSGFDDRWRYIIVYTSTEVTSPEILDTVRFHSRFALIHATEER
jgi:hypothetical protein